MEGSCPVDLREQEDSTGSFKARGFGQHAPRHRHPQRHMQEAQTLCISEKQIV